VLALLRETAKVMPILDARLLDSDPEGAELLTAILNTKPLQRVYGQARFNPSQRVPVGSRTKRCYDSFSQAKRFDADNAVPRVRQTLRSEGKLVPRSRIKTSAGLDQ
jgi:hypothetical protein